MTEDVRQTLYDEQVDAVVRGFVQVWNRFEGTLARELALIQERLEGIRPEKESHPNANYELFYRVGSVINAKGSLTMGELSTALSVPLSTATRIADWLVENGYMQRLPDPDDRRIVRIAFTPRGQELHETIENHIRQRLQQILSGLSRTEQETLFALLGKVVSALKEASK
jgi:DNA-binding MarR family transcriptional regulator